MSARYQACCLNFNRYIVELFGSQWGINRYLTFSLQFQKITREQLSSPQDFNLPNDVTAYIARFDSALSPEELNSENLLTSPEVV